MQGPDTIHRVYRFIAARLEPDNPTTGDAQKFLLLKQAYDVLANPEHQRPNTMLVANAAVVCVPRACYV
jgi:curved DNA-binding protein CbpA